MNIEEGKRILTKHYLAQLKKLKETNFPPREIDFLKIKFSHSFDCYKIGKKIVESDAYLKNKPQEFKNKTELSCLLHDIGRFFELARELSGKAHGLFGAELLRDKDGMTDKMIFIAIAHHDKGCINLEDDKYYETFSENEKRDAIEILKLLRDADKISNLYLFKRKNTIYTRKERRYGFSPEYFEAIENKHLIDKRYKNTIFDSIAYYIIWYHELTFDSSKKFCKENGLIQHLLNMFKWYIDILECDELNYCSVSEAKSRKEEMKYCLSKITDILKSQKVILA